jgi:ADP-heptose:LPS heptosyltransferase
MPPTPAKILVIRNDRLGDLMLAYPTLLLLKQTLPRSTLHVLVSEYTREMALCCTGVDDVQIDPGPRAPMSAQLDLLRRLRRERYDAVVALFSTTRIGLLTAAASIPYRLAPATKVAQAFFNRRLLQRRSRSTKPEYAYNLELGIKFLADHGYSQVSIPTPPYLSFPQSEMESLRARFYGERGIPAEHRLVFIHPGSGGSARNLSIEQYAALAHRLRSSRPFTLVISAGPGEEGAAAKLEALTADLARTVYHSREGLRRFAQHLQLADLFISGSTGPLHIAGALDRPTAAFYTRRRSATALRWQTLNRPERRLAFAPPQTAAEEDMSQVDIAAAAREISERFLG